FLHAQGDRRPRRDRDLAHPRTASGLRGCDQERLREVEEDDRSRSGGSGSEGHREPQEVSAYLDAGACKVGAPASETSKIGRASCRERGETSVGARALKRESSAE